MACKDYSLTSNCDCPDSGCSPCTNIAGCVTFNIKQGDNKPDFKVQIEDCNGNPVDLENQIIEASMWFNSRLLKTITAQQNYIQLADLVGFQQLLVGNIIQIGTGRNFERVTVTGFDEVRRFVYVDRGTNGTAASAQLKGAALRCFKFLNSPAFGEMVFSDTLNSNSEPGMTAYDLKTNQNIPSTSGLISTSGPYLAASYLVYEWQVADTCLAGCFYFEFKILDPVTVPTTTPPPDFGAGFYCINDRVTSGYICMYCPGVDYIIQNNWTYVKGPAASCEDLNYCRQYPSPLTSGLDWTLEARDLPPFVEYSQMAYDPVDPLAYSYSGSSFLSIAPENIVADSVPSVVVAEQCNLPYGIKSMRKYPLQGPGFVIQIWSSNTGESVLVGG
jgi:hypothetical protein